MKKRLISFLLVFAMVLTMLPMTALAAPSDGDTSVNPANPFTDVKETDWFYDAVQYARVNGLVNGATATMFDPDGGMTRGMFVTILGRMAGVDTQEYVGQSVFDDVSVSMYYAPYVAWAYKHGIVNGTGGNQFSPNMKIDRQQLATFFVRYCEAFDVKYGEDTVNTQPADIDEVADWAKDSVLKLWSKGILNGDGTNFNPTDEASRAEAVTLSTRMDTAVETWYSEPGVESDRVRIDPATGEAIKSDDKESEKPGTDNWYDDYYGGYDPGGETTTSYLVEFAIGDLAQEIKDAATPPQSKTYAEGTKIEHLPAPSMQNGLFLGWYYDAALTQPVPADATVTKSLKLYAKMGTVSPVSEEDTPRYITVQVAADNVATYSFKIMGAFDAADITFINVSANNQEYILSDTLSEYDAGGNPQYQYKAVSDGEGGHVITARWKPGQTYSIKLADDSAAVFVVGGAEQTTHIRTLNVITDKAETLQLSVNDGIRYIARNNAKLTGMSDALGGLFTVALDTENGETSIEQVEKTGTFTFTGEAELSDDNTVSLQIGDTVAIYAGVRPDKRELTSDQIAPAAEGDEEPENPNGTVAYVEITDIDGDVYTYKTAESEDVLFTPDILPVTSQVAASAVMTLDGETETYNVTVYQEDMQFTDDVYAQMGLDSQTTVDVGDFIAFYEMEEGGDGPEDATRVKDYGLITNISESKANGKETYIITYTIATLDEVMASMDLYETRNQSIDQDDKVIKEIENELVTQAIESGFVDQAAEYLTALALETDGFQELSGDMDLSSYTITFEDGTPVDEDTMELMAGSRAKITEKDVVANVMAGSVLQHFEDGTGLRAELVLKFEVEVDCNNDNKITISFTAIFEQEVMLTINVSGGAVWKMAWIFPYIADYQMNANLDVGTYTAIGITATAKTVRPDEEPEEPFNWKTATGWKVEEIINQSGQLITKTDEMIANIGEEIEGLMSKAEHFLDTPAVEVPSVGVNGTESAGSVDTGGLAEKYSAMMKDVSDNWIDIVRVEIFASEGHVDPFHILCYGISADFVVSATMHVTIGMTFNFGVAKRYAFSLMLFDREATTETIDLEEAHYNFQFYVMGTIGIRAGIEFEVAVGLFSLKLDSIGISAEVGAYAQMWGYFYYELSWVKGQDKESTCSGALFIEIGIYLSVKLKAQLFSYDKLTYNPTLYENEWPLWSAGDAENVYDFYYPESPDDISEDDFKDEDSGEVDQEAYEEEVAALTELLNMEIENALKFSLPSELFDMNYMDMKTGILHGSDFEEEEEEDDEEGEEGEEGEGEEGGDDEVEASSLYDDIVGDFKDEIFGEEEEEPHENSFPKNYDSNQAGNGDADDEEYFIIELSNDKFTYDPVTNTVTVDSDELEENCEVTITWKGNALAFSTKSLSRTVTITWKNSEAARYISFDGNGGSGTRFISLKVDDPIPAISNPTRVGYIFEGWFEEGSDASFEIPATMPNYAVIRPDHEKGVTVYAKWTPRTDIHYTVKHYLEELGGGYKLAEKLDSRYLPADYSTGVGVEDFYNGTSDQRSQVEARTYPGFTAKAFEQQIVSPNGSTVIEIYYSRNTCTSTFDYDQFDNDDIVVKAKYGSNVFAPSLYMSGYIFNGYDGLTADELATGFMVVGDQTYTAAWELDDNTTYRIERYVERSDLPGKYLLATENAIITVPSWDAGNPVEISSLESAKLNEVGLEFKEIRVNGEVVSSDTITIAADGSTVVKLYHDRKAYTLTFMNGETEFSKKTDAKYGVKQSAPTTDPEKTGWTFVAWSTKDGTNGDWGNEVTFPYTMPGENTTLYAKYTEGTNTAYTVEHYLQDTTGDGYTKVENEDDTYYGKTNSEIVIDSLAKLTITGAEYSYAKVGDTLIEGDAKATIAADGSTVVKLYYDLATYTVDFNSGYTGGTAPEDQTIRHGGKVNTIDNPTRDGYTFDAWYKNAELTQKWNFGTDTVTADTTLYAKWIAKGDTNYTVNYYYMGTDGQYSADPTETAVKDDGVTDQNKTIVPDKVDGFTLDSDNSTLTGLVTADGNLELSVYYTRNQYTASFIHGDGTDSKSDLIFYFGQTITAPTGMNLSKTGYDFAGTWTPAGTAPAIGGTMPAGNVTYNADWTPWTYTVRFNANTNASYEGTVAEQTFNYDETKALGSDSFTRPGSGYTMTGWTIEGGDTVYTGGAQVNFSQSITQNGQIIDLYAVWQEGASTTYTVKYYKMNVDGNGYTEDTTLKQTPNGIVGANVSVTPTAPTGFKLNDSKNVLSGTVTDGGALVLEVYYDRNQYDVTVDKADGSATVTTPHYYGATVTVPAAPTKTGSAFLGWSDGISSDIQPGATFTMGTTPVTLTAQWRVVAFTVSFNVNADGDNSVTVNPASKQVTYDLTYGDLASVTERTGYTFAGWYTAATGGTKVESTTTVTETAAHTLYAHWTPNQYTITFNTLGGNNQSSITQGYMTTVNLPTPTHSDASKSFQGWYYDAECAQAVGTSIFMPLNGTTLYAKWGVKTYTVTLDLGEHAAAGQSTSITLKHDGTYEALYNPESATAFWKFVQWKWTNPSNTRGGYFVNEDGVYSAREPDSDVKNTDHTLTAEWARVTFNLSFNLNGGVEYKGDLSANCDYTEKDLLPGDSTTIIPAAPTKLGCTFLGWRCSADNQLYAASNGNSWEPKYNYTMPAEGETEAGQDVVFTAEWKADQYTIIVYADEAKTQVLDTVNNYSVETNGDGRYTLPGALVDIDKDGVKYQFYKWMYQGSGSASPMGSAGKTFTFEEMIDCANGTTISLYPSFAHYLQYIDNYAELKELSTLYNSSNGTPPANVPEQIYLNADIALDRESWVSIGYGNGTTSTYLNFDGQNHTITMDNGTFEPIFANLAEDSKVTNLTVKVSNVTAKSHSNTEWGAIAGRNYGTIENCTVIGMGNAIDGNYHIYANTSTAEGGSNVDTIGALVGYSGSGSVIENCYVKAADGGKLVMRVDEVSYVPVIGGMVGGLAGEVRFYKTDTLVYVDITTDAVNDGACVGGIAGSLVRYEGDRGTISDFGLYASIQCNVTLSDKESLAYAGGIAGNASSGSIGTEICVTNSTITGAKDANKVGLLTGTAGTNVVNNCSSDKSYAYYYDADNNKIQK